MSNELQSTQPKAATVRSLVASPAIAARFKEVLKDKAPQFVSSLINIANGMKDVEPNSVIQSAMVAAALDLPIDKNLGFAWIVPFKNKGVKQAQFQMGFKGFIQLGLRSGQYKRMNARAINEEAFKDFDDVGEPVIDWSKIDEAKPVHGYVFAFQLVNGFTKCAFWTKTRVEEHAKRYSQSFRGGYDSPWKSHFDEMALKTVIKNELSKWGILSIDMQRAIEKDQAVIDVDGSSEYVDNTHPQISDQQQSDGPKFVAATSTATTPIVPIEAAKKPELATPEPSSEPSFEEVVDGESKEMIELKAAMALHGVTEERLIKFASSKSLTKPEAHGREIDTLKLTDILDGKLIPLTKNILANGATLKSIKEGV